MITLLFESYYVKSCRERSFININSSPQAVFKVPRRNYLLTDLYLMRMVAILSQTN